MEIARFRGIRARPGWAALVATGLLSLAVLAGCSSTKIASDTATATEPSSTASAAVAATPSPPPAGDTAAGWKSFKLDNYSGLVREEWTPYALTPEEAQQLAQKGIAAFKDSLSTAVATAAKSFSVDQSVLLVLFNDQDNVNVQQCETQVTSLLQMTAGYKALGISFEQAGTVTFAAKKFSLLKVAFLPDADTYQALVQDGRCTSIITFTSFSKSPGALADFQAFAEHLQIAKR